MARSLATGQSCFQIMNAGKTGEQHSAARSWLKLANSAERGRFDGVMMQHGGMFRMSVFNEIGQQGC